MYQDKSLSQKGKETNKINQYMTLQALGIKCRHIGGKQGRSHHNFNITSCDGSRSSLPKSLPVS